MKSGFTFLIVALLLSSPVLAQVTGCPDGSQTPSHPDATREQMLFDMINTYRTTYPWLTSDLIRSPELDHAAQTHAEDMAEEGYAHHDSYDNSTRPTTGCIGPGSFGGTLQCNRPTRIKNFYLGTNVKTEETLAFGWSNADSVMFASNQLGWTTHEAHDTILRNVAWKEVGIGYYFKQNDTYCGHYWAVNFGARDEVNSVEDLPLVKYEMTNLTPNPANGSTQFSLTSERAQQVNIQLYNLMGQQVQTIFQGSIQANKKSNFEINTGQLEQGMYVCLVKGDHFETMQKVIVSR